MPPVGPLNRTIRAPLNCVRCVPQICTRCKFADASIARDRLQLEVNMNGILQRREPHRAHLRTERRLLRRLCRCLERRARRPHGRPIDRDRCRGIRASLERLYVDALAPAGKEGSP